MIVEKIVNSFLQRKYELNMGAGKLAKRYSTRFGEDITRKDVYEAKEIARNILKSRIPTNITKRLPKILLFDIETSPSIAFAWRRFKENISIDQVIQDPIMLTWSAKWLYSPTLMSDKITVEEIKKFDDYRIVKSLWDLIDEADIVVAHYGDGFDVPMLNSRAIINGLPPFSMVQSIDTKRVASKHFKFPSNKLDAIASYFKVGQKIKTDFDLWKNCLIGEDSLREKTISKMETYNVQDVVVLEEVYLKLRPYIKSHPNVGLYVETDKEICPNCGSTELEQLDKPYYTQTGKFETLRCNCGAIARRRLSSYNKEIRENLIVGIAR